jgi:hypothetical protein
MVLFHSGVIQKEPFILREKVAKGTGPRRLSTGQVLLFLKKKLSHI